MVSWIPNAFDINNKPTLSKKDSTNQRVTWNGMHFCLVHRFLVMTHKLGRMKLSVLPHGKSLYVSISLWVLSSIWTTKWKSFDFVKDWFFGWVRIISFKELRLQFKIGCEQRNIGTPCLICGRHLSSCPNIKNMKFGNIWKLV